MKIFDEDARGFRAIKKEAQLLQRRKRVFDDEQCTQKPAKKKTKRVRINPYDGEL